ncbi:LPS export ABC transporter periplasmic protein LptC [Campylobacter concisus]|uniref:LPS export ABC transporter periplasmic protein LptC n=1 Tax=Campylobacter concisus TaxID=199 RepID=UPI003D1B92E0
MVEALVVKIFYFVVAIFSVVMIFLATQDPYLANVLKIDTKISNMQINDVIDYEINSTKISGVYEADELNRYNDKDEFLSFKAKILRGNLRHFLSSDKAISQNDEIIFQKNANYENNDSLRFISDEVIYGTKTKIVRSEANFTLIRNNDKALGESGSYDLGKKQTQVKGLRAWIEENQRF